MIDKKKCIVVTAFEESQPGFLVYSYRIRSLAKIYKLTVISAFPLVHNEFSMPDVNYIVTKSSKGFAGWLKYLCNCAKMIRREKPAVAVLLHSKAAPVAVLLKKIPCATYWNEHPSHVAPRPKKFSPVKTPFRAFVRWLMFKGAQQSSVVMPIGEAHYDDLIAHGCQEKNVTMLYMGVDPKFSNTNAGKTNLNVEKPLQLIYVGSVSAERGRDVMLEAIRSVNRVRKTAHLTIIGASDEQIEYCRAAARRLQIEDSVLVQGRVAGNKIPAVLDKADVGLCLWEDLPWHQFNPPTKLFEYLVAGVPVLASNIRTHTKYIENGVNGIVFNYDSASLAHAIDCVSSDRAELMKMKLRARQSGLPYLWNTIEPTFIECVQRVSH